MSYDDGSGEWMNPPPPGTVEDQHGDPVKDRYLGPDRFDKDYRQFPRSPNKYGGENCTNLSALHNIPARSRTRSRSNDRYSKHYRDRRRRSRSRDYRRRRSRSRSSSRKRYDKRYSHKSYRRYSRSRSRSRSRRHRRSRSRSPRRGSHSRSWSTTSNSDNESYGNKRRLDVLKNQEYTRKVYSKHKKEIEEEEEEEEVVQENTFKNDGSFLEMFKKMQEEQQALAAKAAAEETEASASETKKPAPLLGKRRGGRVLKTGMVQKLKNPNELDEEPKDAWSVYMKEVRKYKEACCDDDSKTRPLVK